MKTQFNLINLDCANCASKIENHLRKHSLVRDVSVNFATLTLHIDTDDIGTIREEIRKIEPGVDISPLENIDNSASVQSDTTVSYTYQKQIALISITAVLFINMFIFEKSLSKIFFGYGDYLVALFAYLLCGWSVLVKAAKTIYNKQWFNEHVLMAIATIGALTIHALDEAVGVMIFYQIGELIQSFATNRSRRSIKKLLQIRPDFAHLKTESGLKRVSPISVSVGDIVMVKPGEKIPLDSIVIDGNSQIDTSILTGESKPKKVTVENSVFAGEINISGLLTLRVLKPFSESSVARILNLVENAAEKKTKTENFVTTFARYYTPAVVILAACIAVIPPLFIQNQLFTIWIYRALVLLVISCPCAFIVSIPLGYFGGLGAASRKGILIKGSNYIDALAKIGSVVFDKTGTLTKGNFSVQNVIACNGYESETVLRFAAIAEYHSNHPIAKSIISAFSMTNDAIDGTSISSYQEISGHGVKVIFDGHCIVAGNDLLMNLERIVYNDTNGLKETIVHVAFDNKYAGCISIGDEIRDDSIETVKQLHRLGIHDISMLSGDNEQTANNIGKKLNIKKIHAGLLPEHKVRIFESIANSKSHKGSIAFVGDGINDSPVLARADVGIAMGVSGTDAAIETADVVLMSDHPSNVVQAIKIGKRTRTIVLQNIIMVLIIKVIFVSMGSVGIASMWEAVFADIGVALLAVLNSTRALNHH